MEVDIADEKMVTLLNTRSCAHRTRRVGGEAVVWVGTKKPTALQGDCARSQWE